MHKKASGKSPRRAGEASSNTLKKQIFFEKEAGVGPGLAVEKK
jgi:hypothetical protein